MGEHNKALVLLSVMVAVLVAMTTVPAVALLGPVLGVPVGVLGAVAWVGYAVWRKDRGPSRFSRWAPTITPLTPEQIAHARKVVRG